MGVERRHEKGKGIEENEGLGEIYTPSGQPMTWVSAPRSGGLPTMVTPTGYQMGIGSLPQFQTPPGHQNPTTGARSAGQIGAGISAPY